MFRIEIEKEEKSYAIFQSTDIRFPFWFENEDGEGMGLTEKDLFDILDKAFKDKF